MILNRILLLLMLMAQWRVGIGQTAPNFTVTDSWGNTHRLYEDYLDQDKTMVLKIFYVACPPCNAIAPYLEPLYQDWGGGQSDVQFLELSIKLNDWDALVNGYKEMHHTTYPASGGEGGSVPAAEPYKNGTFGPYTGTPTFVVIAPNRSVNYDISGANIPATIEALDQAIAATGAEGLNTATSDPGQPEILKLKSNIVQDKLIFQAPDQGGEFEILIMNTLGQVYNQIKMSGTTDEEIQLDISSLPAGLWLSKVTSKENTAVASYLFIKS